MFYVQAWRFLYFSLSRANYSPRKIERSSSLWQDQDSEMLRTLLKVTQQYVTELAGLGTLVRLISQLSSRLHAYDRVKDTKSLSKT